MNLLLIYPKPADTPKSRLSRADVQLNGITHTTRSVLAELADQDSTVSISEIGVGRSEDIRPGRSADAALPKDELQKVLAENDIVIDIARTPDLHAQASDSSGTVMHLCPAFPGSFACNDIMFKASGKLQQSEIVETIKQARAPFDSEKPRTHELDASMHYAAFTPLPDRVEHAFYDSEREHALVFLSYADNEMDTATREEDKSVLANILHTAENVRSLTFICESLTDLPMVKDVADEIASSLGIEPNIWGLRKGDFHDMFSVMAKTDLVFFGGNSLYADAILRGRPAYAWRTRQANSEAINTALVDYFDHGNRDRLLQEQRMCLDALFAQQYSDAALPNHRQCFETTLLAILKSQFSNLGSVNATNTDKPALVIPEARLMERKRLNQSVGQSVWSKRHKIAKFRTSLVARGIKDVVAESEQVYVRLK